jgi:hypothetical protein
VDVRYFKHCSHQLNFLSGLISHLLDLRHGRVNDGLALLGTLLGCPTRLIGEAHSTDCKH